MSNRDRPERDCLAGIFSRVVDDDLLKIETSWPGTTIGGEPGVVCGMLTVSRAAGGEFLLNLAVGPSGGGPETCDYVECPLSAEHAQSLREALKQP